MTNMLRVLQTDSFYFEILKYPQHAFDGILGFLINDSDSFTIDLEKKSPQIFYRKRNVYKFKIILLFLLLLAL